METVQCNLCGSRDEARVIVGRDRLVKIDQPFQVVRCRQCRLVYFNPRPDSTELRSHYPSEYATFVRDLARAGFSATVVRGVPAALVATTSLQLLWNGWRGVDSTGIISSRALLVALFAASALLARAGLSAHMAAEAVKPS